MDLLKRVCFFAGYNHNGTIADYALYYISEISKFADVYYLSDCETPPDELNKLSLYIKEGRYYSYRHKKYDFGSWQELINIIGLEELNQYDEFIFANDSCFAPIFSFEPLFNATSADKDIDAWSAYALTSFFWVLKKKAFFANNFQEFIQTIKQEKDKETIIRNYEGKLRSLFDSAGLKYQTFSPLKERIDNYNEWKTFLVLKFPFLKVRVFTEQNKYHHNQSLVNWEKFIRKYSNYDTNLIKSHLVSMGVKYKDYDKVTFKIKSLLWAISRMRLRFFRIYFSKTTKIIVLFGKTVLERPLKEPIETFYNNIKFD